MIILAFNWGELGLRRRDSRVHNHNGPCAEFIYANIDDIDKLGTCSVSITKVMDRLVK